MGYFSMLDIDHEDYSYPPPERQLEMRLDILKDRLQELKEKGAVYRFFLTDGAYLSDDDIRYVQPESLKCIYHVEKAIELAIEDLREKYGIILTENGYREYDELEKPAVFGLNKIEANRLITAA